MTSFNVDNVNYVQGGGAQCAALFASGLQRSDVLTSDAVADAVSRTVRQLGVNGCVGLMAQEFGDHPETATDRMRWILQLVGETPARAARPAADSIRHAA
jgi:hypothetical protein